MGDFGVKKSPTVRGALSGGVFMYSQVGLPLKSVVIRLAVGFKSLDKYTVPWAELSDKPFKTFDVLYINVVEFDDDKVFGNACIFESATQHFRDSNTVAKS